MAIVRTNPLPTGRYWIWIAADKEPAWLALRQQNLEVLKIESEAATHEGYGWNETRSGTTYIFTVTGSLAWPTGIGYPNTAGDDVKTPADVLQRPQVPTLSETATEVTDWAAGLFGDVYTWVIIGGLIYLASQRKSGR